MTVAITTINFNITITITITITTTTNIHLIHYHLHLQLLRLPHQQLQQLSQLPAIRKSRAYPYPGRIFTRAHTTRTHVLATLFEVHFAVHEL
jgi:hypothetical protein